MKQRKSCCCCYLLIYFRLFGNQPIWLCVCVRKRDQAEIDWKQMGMEQCGRADGENWQVTIIGMVSVFANQRRKKITDKINEREKRMGEKKVDNTPCQK